MTFIKFANKRTWVAKIKLTFNKESVIKEE